MKEYYGLYFMRHSVCTSSILCTFNLSKEKYNRHSVSLLWCNCDNLYNVVGRFNNWDRII